MTKQKWPEHISGTENAEFLKKIKIEHIQRAVFERDDEYYEHVGSGWTLTLELLVDGQEVDARIRNEELRLGFEGAIRESRDFVLVTYVPFQYGRYIYSRKEMLTREVVEKTELEDILYAEISSAGAMGDCGSARLYTKSGHFYYVNIMYDDAGNDGYLALDELVSSEKASEYITDCYGGFGNHSYKQKDTVFVRNNAECAFLCAIDDEKAIEIKPSCNGVYDRIAIAFTQGKISAQTLREWLRYEDKFLPDELHIVRYYGQYLEKFENIETTLDDYINVLVYARFENGLDSHYDWEDYIDDWRNSLAKYRLRYILYHENAGAYANCLAAMDIEKVKPGDLFKAVSAALDRDISKLFLNCKAEQIDHFGLDADTRDNYPFAVELSKAEHERIVEQILAMNGRELRCAKSLGFYFANCIFNLDKLELTTVLPAALHVLREMPNEEDLYYTKRTYWAAADLVNTAWKIIGDPETPQRFEQEIYDACWPRIGDLWPVKHAGEYRFVDDCGDPNELAEYIFNECLGFMVGLKKLDKFNPELYQYFLKADDSNEQMIRGRTLEERCKKLSCEDALAEYEKFNADYIGACYPNDKQSAEYLFKMLLSGEDESLDEQVWFDTYSSSHFVGVGSYLVELANKNFDRIRELLGDDNTIRLFYAACYNAEVDMYEPLKEFGERVSELPNAEKRFIKSALGFAKKTIETTKFQRESLLAEYSKPTKARKTTKKLPKIETEEIGQLRSAAKLALKLRCLTTALLQRNLKIGYGRASHLLDLLEKLEVVRHVGGNKPHATIIASIEEFEEKIK